MKTKVNHKRFLFDFINRPNNCTELNTHFVVYLKPNQCVHGHIAIKKSFVVFFSSYSSLRPGLAFILSISKCINIKRSLSMYIRMYVRVACIELPIVSKNYF